MTTDTSPHPHYGFSVYVFAYRKTHGDAIIVGGLSAGRQRWTRVLSRRAAGMLWTFLAQQLQPARWQTQLAAMATLPMREQAMPTITTRFTLDLLDDGGFEFVGFSGSSTWAFALNRDHALRFWFALTKALDRTSLNTADDPAPTE